METTATIQSLLEAIFNPFVLIAAVGVTLAVLSGGAARLVEFFDRV